MKIQNCKHSHTTATCLGPFKLQPENFLLDVHLMWYIVILWKLGSICNPISSSLDSRHGLFVRLFAPSFISWASWQYCVVRCAPSVRILLPKVIVDTNYHQNYRCNNSTIWVKANFDKCSLNLSKSCVGGSFEVVAILQWFGFTGSLVQPINVNLDSR